MKFFWYKVNVLQNSYNVRNTGISGDYVLLQGSKGVFSVKK